MRIAVLLLVSLLGGCFVLPSKTTTTRALGTQKSDAKMGLSRGLALSTKAEHQNVIITVIRKRDCHREISQVFQVTERRGLRMGGAEDERAVAFGAMLAPATLPISFVISSLSLIGNRTHRYEKRQVVGVETSACTQPADQVPVEVTLASGLTFTRRTERDGTVTFRLPRTEPYKGVVRARAETAVVELKYRRKPPAVTAVRDAVQSCAQEVAYSGELEVRVGVDPAGRPTKVELDHGDAALTTCITTRVAEARFPQEQRDTTLVLPFALAP